MEVSSHALELHRADAIHFAAAIFTNLTQDHLDFHPTMEDYFSAKRRLFADGGPTHAVVNVDDRYGASARGRAGARRSRSRSTPDAQPTGRRGRRQDLDGSQVHGRDARRRARAALAAARAVQRLQRARGVRRGPRARRVDRRLRRRAIETAGQVPGRFETVDEGQDFAVLVDYAHTPDSLENVLRAARALTTGRVHVVFGCGGDRDRGKRPLMGEIADPAGRPRDRHLRQPALRGPRGDHRSRSSPAPARDVEHQRRPPRGDRGSRSRAPAAATWS